MKKRLFSNPGLKIASVAIAFFVWLIIVNRQDPVISRTISNVPVTVTNTAYVESMGLSYHVVNNSNTVSVTVRGNRSVVEQLYTDSITASADLMEIVSMEADPIIVPVRVSAPGIAAGSISANPGTLQIELEEIKSADFVINGSVGGTTPANGFEVGKLTVDPDRVTISGPASLIEIIDRVEATVSVSRLSEDTELTTGLQIYDKNGQQLSETQRSYLKFSIDSKNVTVKVDLYQVVTDVNIVVEGYSGAPLAGYQVTGISTTPATISVVGDDRALANLAANGNQILLPSAVADATGASKTFDVRLEGISSYLPDGVTLSNGTSEIVIIAVEVLPNNSKSFVIPTSQIARINSNASYNYVANVSEFTVGVTAPDSILSSLKPEDIKVSVELEGVTPGVHTLPLVIELPSGCELVEDVELTVTVSEPIPSVGSSGGGNANSSGAGSGASNTGSGNQNGSTGTAANSNSNTNTNGGN